VPIIADRRRKGARGSKRALAVEGGSYDLYKPALKLACTRRGNEGGSNTCGGAPRWRKARGEFWHGTASEMAPAGNPLIWPVEPKVRAAHARGPTRHVDGGDRETMAEGRTGLR